VETEGQTFGAKDLWIAAKAQVLGATLVTDDEREFLGFDGLAVENWLAG
jgi:predicted nucleic acid-binding protein